MMNFWGFLGGSTTRNEELPFLFPLGVKESVFIQIDVTSMYAKILTDVFERSQGLSDDEVALLSDNCLASEKAEGLISLLACAMYEKSDLFLVYDKATKVIRKATREEQTLIESDYKKQAESKTGVYISFKKYLRTDMVRLYSALEYCTVGSLNKMMNLSKAAQLKISDLRSTVAMLDKDEAKAQGKAIALGLSNGRDVMLDAKDVIETAKPDLTSTQSAMELLNEKKSFYYGMPCSYITGELNSGLGDTGQADAKANDRGFKGYFASICRPVAQALFGKKITFKSDDFMQLESSLSTLKTVSSTGDELLSGDNKRIIINKLFGLPVETKGDPPEKTPPISPNAPPIPGKPVVPPPKG